MWTIQSIPAVRAKPMACCTAAICRACTSPQSNLRTQSWSSEEALARLVKKLFVARAARQNSSVMSSMCDPLSLPSRRSKQRAAVTAGSSGSSKHRYTLSKPMAR